MNPISPLIHLVDDDASVREALALLIGTVGLRVAPWADPQDFLARFDRDAVGAIVLDMRMPGLSGLALIDELRAQGVDQPVVMLTGHGSVDMCRRAFKAGAAEFLEKPVDDEALLGAVQAAVRTHLALRRQDAAGREARQRHALLSAREREVLALVIKGQTSKQIARALQLSPRTVETHRAHLQDKLQVQTLAQLVRQYAALVDEGAA
ncbi:MAG: response regulator [Proteobacteria bacterium]|nr:response regulator transcription factor [Burkholderiales bacterium]MCA0311331.1 response regulator [Pseudomonadota bacterium]